MRLKNKKKITVPGLLFCLCLLSATLPDMVACHDGISHLSAVDTVRPDVITIDSMKVFGALERAPVPFLHDLHVQGVLDSPTGKNRPLKETCGVCHLSDDGEISWKFIRRRDTTRDEVRDVFHANCMACHEKMKIKQEPTGPLSCGECHVNAPRVTFTRVPMGFDKSLHYRHSNAHQDKCGTCHHEYDSKARTLSHTPGKEDTCRVCHEKKPTTNPVSMRNASHRSCIGCHLKNTDVDSPGKKINGPIHCSGCHDQGTVSSIPKVKVLPRIKRNQPDTVMIKTGDVDVDETYRNRMDFVPFDHKSHEIYSETCRECHHAGISSCNNCHTLKGSEKGEYINLELAMHQPGSVQSCRGCHEKEQEKKACIGCHAFLGGDRDYNQKECSKCHMTSDAREGTTSSEDRIDQAMDGALENLKENHGPAATLLTSRKMIHATYTDAEIPETVVIDDLVDEYEAVTFPHRKVVKSLLTGVKGNTLANYFHSNKGTFCQGCHHNSPATEKPTQCGSCHGKPFNKRDLLKPGLMGAFHRQCLECHRLMDISSPAGCTDCHEKKQK